MSKNLIELCTICQRFCDILDQNLLNSVRNKSAKSNSEEIKKENADTNDQCFPQTMLFFEKYYQGKVTSINLNSAYDYDINSTHIAKFNKDLAQFGRGSNTVRYDYHEGITVEHSQFLGGARKPFEERVNANSVAGRYGQLKRQWQGRGQDYEINHVPPKASYKGTPYENIKINEMPAVIMFMKDHRAMSSTGSSNVAKEYRRQIHKYLQEGDMYNAIRLELMNTLKINKDRSYERNVRAYIEYVATTPIRDAPLNSEGTTTLITRQQADNLLDDLFGNKRF